MQTEPCEQVDCQVDTCRSKRIVGRSKKAGTTSRMNFSNAVVAPIGVNIRSCTGQDVEHVYVWIHDKSGFQIDFG